MIPAIILGAGGHAKVLVDVIRLMGIPILGLTDAEADKAGSLISGVPVLGVDDLVFGYDSQAVWLVNGLGSVGLAPQRRRLFEQYKKKNYLFMSVVHSSAVIAVDAERGMGVQVMAGAVLQPGSCVGDNVIVNTNATVDHDCIIGSHVHIAPGATLSGGVRISDGVHIGTGATIIQGITVGVNSVVAAGAVVTEHVPDGVVVAGVPAKIYRQSM